MDETDDISIKAKEEKSISGNSESLENIRDKEDNEENHKSINNINNNDNSDASIKSPDDKKPEEDNNFFKKHKTAKHVIVGLGIFLVVILLAVGLSMILFGETTFEYHGLTFEKVLFGGKIFVYRTNITISTPDPLPYTLVLRNDPRKLDSIPVNFSVLHAQGFFSFTPNTLECKGDALIAAFQIGQFVKVLGGNITATVTENFSNNTLPVKTCDDATKNVSVLILRPFSEQSRIYVDENNSNCIILEAQNCSVTEVSERFVLALLEKSKRTQSFTDQIAQVVNGS